MLSAAYTRRRQSLARPHCSVATDYESTLETNPHLDPETRLIEISNQPQQDLFKLSDFESSFFDPKFLPNPATPCYEPYGFNTKPEKSFIARNLLELTTRNTSNRKINFISYSSTARPPALNIRKSRSWRESFLGNPGHNNKPQGLSIPIRLTNYVLISPETQQNYGQHPNSSITLPDSTPYRTLVVPNQSSHHKPLQPKIGPLSNSNNASSRKSSQSKRASSEEKHKTHSPNESNSTESVFGKLFLNEVSNKNQKLYLRLREVLSHQKRSPLDKTPRVHSKTQKLTSCLRKNNSPF